MKIGHETYTVWNCRLSRFTFFFFIHQPFFCPFHYSHTFIFVNIEIPLKRRTPLSKSGSMNNCVKRSLDVNFCGKISDIKQKKHSTLSDRSFVWSDETDIIWTVYGDTLNHSFIHSFIYWISTTLYTLIWTKTWRKERQNHSNMFGIFLFIYCHTFNSNILIKSGTIIIL